jgi:hypothetical protein
MPLRRLGCRVEEHVEGAGVLDAQFPVVFFEVDAGEEGLVAQTPVGLVAAGVDVLASRSGASSRWTRASAYSPWWASMRRFTWSSSARMRSCSRLSLAHGGGDPLAVTAGP